MAGGGGKGGGTTGSSTTTLPENIYDASNTNLAAGYDAASNLLGPYTGATYAEMTPGAQADVAGLQSQVGSSQPAYNLAQSTLGGLTSYAPQTINAPSLATTNLSQYENPYTQAVTDTGLQAINTQRLQALNQNADQATAQGAFGGSRQGVQEGITNAAASAAAGQLASQNAANAYTNAQQAAQYDIGNNLQTQQANVANSLSGAGLNANAANALGTNAGAAQTANLQGLMAALQGQTLAQQNQQGILTANQNAYNAAQQFPIQQLQIAQGSLAATPYGTTTTTSAPSNGLMQGLGAASSGIGILGSLFGSGGLFSDRREKTDIKKLGKDEQSGLDLYAYRYKDDPKTYPKVVGPMAQDIEKRFPGSTKKIGGHLVVKKVAA